MFNEAFPFGIESAAYFTGSDISEKFELFIVALLEDMNVLPAFSYVI